jgi:hypothetical protein
VSLVGKGMVLRLLQACLTLQGRGPAG